MRSAHPLTLRALRELLAAVPRTTSAPSRSNQDEPPSGRPNRLADSVAPMSHLPPSTAIFSPSVARIAASLSKDWNHVDGWLVARFHGKPPPFERNAATLKALVALAALNEAADEERDLVARLESSAAAADSPAPGSDDDVPTALLGRVEDGLLPHGRLALEAMASAAASLGIALPEPQSLARGLMQLQGQVVYLDLMAGRVGVLQRHVAAELAEARAVTADLEGDEYRPPAHLAKQNLELHRTIRAAAATLPDLKEKAAVAAIRPQPTVDQVHIDECGYLRLLSQKKELQVRLDSFHGLPPDRGLARQELEDLRAELRAVTQRRDAVFDGLVDRETPRKRLT